MRSIKLSRLFAGILFLSVIVAGCMEEEDGSGDQANADRIFLDYQVTAEESGENVTCKFQFRVRSLDGTAFSLQKPARVELDGEELKPDSTKFNGVYYELVKPQASFRGKHHIVFTAPGGRQYKEEFEFIPFSMENEIPYQIKREDLVIKFKDFPPGRIPLRLVMTDTAFNSSWVNKQVVVNNGELIIANDILDRLKTGPIGLELHRERRLSFDQPTRAGGKFVINYSLKRELELIE